MAIEWDESPSGPSFDGRCVRVDDSQPDLRCPAPCLPDDSLCAKHAQNIIDWLDFMERAL